MAADVVGYSRLMEEDAARTVATLRRLRAELFAPAVAGHRGRVVKSMGDGWIVTFASASDAVTCAMRLQDQMVLEPDIQIRIGVHVGDVSVMDEDVFGEGVNIAARLEALTEPGGVTVSDAVHALLDGTLRPAFDDAGAQELKNIDRPVRVWTRGGLTGATTLAASSGMAGFPQLVIVPVATSSGDPDVVDLANALTHDFGSFLGATRWLDVATRQTPEQTGYVLSSILRARGSRLRLEVRLQDAKGQQIWTSKLDGALDDAFAWQDDSASEVASHVSAAIIEARLAQLNGKPEDTWSWQDWYMRALMAARSDYQGMKTAIEFGSKCLSLKPPSSMPYEIMLAALAASSSLGYDDLVAQIAPKAAAYHQKAGELGGSARASRILMTFSSYVQDGDVAKAKSEIADCLRDLPFDPEALMFAGYLFQFLGEPEQALACYHQFDTIARHHPYRSTILSGKGSALHQLGRSDEALVHLNEALRLVPGHVAAQRWRIAALALIGRIDDAQAALDMHQEMLPDTTLAKVRAGSRYVQNAATDRYFEGLRLAGMPE